MRFPVIIAIVLLVAGSLVDLYIYAALRSYCRNRIYSRLQGWGAIACALLLLSTVYVVFFTPAIAAGMWMVLAYTSIYAVKYAFFICDVLSRIPMLWRGRRWAWMSGLGLAVGIIIFITMWWGALYGRNCLQVREVTVEVPGLPAELDGMTIAQFSDLHTGTFGSSNGFIDKLVNKINSLSPDVIVFTGDIVNCRSAELKPHMASLSRLRAPMGVYSILGNHDYADYARPGLTEAERQADVDSLCMMENRMGWQMLNNSHVMLGPDSIGLVLIGVENIGEPPFKTYVDLSSAYPTLSDSRPKVLLSHNPKHWSDDIAGVDSVRIDLTLSGHTHAMQCEVAGISPCALRYPLWSGLYDDGYGKKLYVNIGVGEVGFPFRIGATPEITLFTLKSANQ